MALKKCKECGGQVSTTAKACPSCGAAPPKKTSIVTWLAAIVIVPVVAVSVLSDKEPAPERPEMTAEQKAAKEKSSKEYATILLVKKLVQASLKDPDSAKFGKVFYKDPGYVCGYVNAKNSYGGMTGDKEFMVEVSTSKLRMIDGSASFANEWNTICAK